MQPLGRKPIKFPGKINYNFRKSVRNWWEAIGTEDKKRSRRQAKKEISKHLKGSD